MGLPALWNVCPTCPVKREACLTGMKREAGFIGAKPIPLGWLIKKPARYGRLSVLGYTFQGQNHGCKDFGVPYIDLPRMLPFDFFAVKFKFAFLNKYRS